MQSPDQVVHEAMMDIVDGSCALCGDPCDDERLCASCAIDVEMEIDEMLDWPPKPEND